MPALLARAVLFRGLGLRVQGAGFRVQGSGFRVLGVWLRVEGCLGVCTDRA